MIRSARPSASSIASRPSFAASGMNGPSTSRSSAPIDGMLTAFVTSAALERGDHLLGHDHAGPVLRLLGRGGQVRRGDDVVELEQRAVVRLLGVDVDRRRGELAGAQRLDQRLLVDELAAGGVDHPRAVGQLGDRLAVRGSRASRASAAGAASGTRRRRAPRPGSRRARRRARGSAPSRRTGRRRRRASRARARAGRPAGRCGRSRARRASCPRARPRPRPSAPSAPASAPRAPAGCCGRARPAGRRCARRPR